jgi:hypothetical protein
MVSITQLTSLYLAGNQFSQVAAALMVSITHLTSPYLAGNQFSQVTADLQNSLIS